LNVCPIDLLQNCISFNRLNAFHWYKEHVYRPGDDHDPTDPLEAFRRFLEWGEKISTGNFYINKRPTFEQGVPVIKDTPLIKHPFSMKTVKEELKNFY
jgi:2-oxoglutarate ferredoxin oxidoreductase subunit beta